MPTKLLTTFSVGLTSDATISDLIGAQGIDAGTLLLGDPQPTLTAPTAPTAQSAPLGTSGAPPDDVTKIVADNVAFVSPNIRFSKGAVSALLTKQFWEGTVVAVHAEDFVAVVKDHTNPQNPDEEVVIGLDEVSPPDHQLVAPGAAFYWFIGAEITPAKQQKNVSLILFRRMPRWTARTLARATAHGQQLLDGFRAPGR